MKISTMPLKVSSGIIVCFWLHYDAEGGTIQQLSKLSLCAIGHSTRKS